MYVSIIRPLGYEPNALPLRQFAARPPLQKHHRAHATNKQTRGPLVKPKNKTTWRIRVSIPVLNLAKVVCYHVQQSPAHTLHITPHLLPTHNGPKQQRFKSSKRIGGSGYRSRFSTLRRLYATMYNNPPSASFGTRTRTYTLEGCNSTLKLRMHPAGLWSARGVHTPPLAIHGSCTPPAWMAEWSKALDSSSSLSGGVGSNPTSSTLFFLICRVNPPPVSFFLYRRHSSCGAAVVPPSSVGRAPDF